MSQTPRLLAVSVGAPSELPPPPKGWRGDPPWRKRLSAIGKETVGDAVHLGTLGLDGDSQVDRKHHGGPDRAVNVYCADHFADWRVRLDLPDLAFGAFGENFTVGVLDERTGCIGDIFAVGEVLVQVTQPRQPCWKLARKLNVKDIVAQVEQLGRTGWYMRVLREGQVEAGLPFALVERPHPEWPIDRAYGVFRARNADPAAAAELARCPALSADWRAQLLRAPKSS